LVSCLKIILKIAIYGAKVGKNYRFQGGIIAASGGKGKKILSKMEIYGM
jgi:hypothetical protein